MSSGYVDNPFYDEDSVRQRAPVAGVAASVAPRLALEWPGRGGHGLSVSGAGHLDRHPGDGGSLGGGAALGFGWRWSGARVSASTRLLGRYSELERYPSDTRWTGGASAELSWSPATSWWITPKAFGEIRDYPERPGVEADGAGQEDVALGGSVAVRAPGFAAGSVVHWPGLEIGGWSVQSNAPELSRAGGRVELGVEGRWRRWSWAADGRAWLIDYRNQARADVAGGGRGDLGLDITGWLTARVVGHGLSSWSDDAEGRYRHWGVGVEIDLHHAWRPDPVVELVPGLVRLGAGRWRFAIERPGARRVALTGDFDGWRRSTPLQRIGDLWVCEIELPPGRQTFMFVVDGRLEAPPFGPLIDDGFGGRVGVVHVMEAER